mgnify:CR=1 FL=1
MPPASQTRALGVLVFGACAIGFGPILVRLTEAGPAAAAFWRFLLAVPLITLLLAVSGRGRAGADRRGPDRLLLLAGGFIATDLAFWHYGLKLTSVANATVLSNLTPILVTAFAWFAFREKPRAVFLAGMLLAIGGAALMAVAGDPSRLRPGSDPLRGDLFSAVAAFWYAAYFIAVARARRTRTALNVMLWSTLAALPFLLAFALGLGEDLTPASLAGWGACAGLALMHVAGQGSIAWALGRLPTAVTAVVVLIQPVVAAALGWLMFGETLTPLQALGGAGALAGVALAQLSSTTRTPAKVVAAPQR